MDDKKPVLTVMCGLPASGKSTYAHKLAEETNATVFSSDELRVEMFGNVNDQQHNSELFIELHRRIKDCLRSGNNAVYDACNINSKRRRAFLQELNKIECTKNCVIMATLYKQCLKNNKNRDKKVPEYTIERMYKQFQCPHNFEGWDEIFVRYNNSFIKPDFNKGSFESMARYKMKGFNQNNPHHLYDLYDYSKALALQYKETDIRRVSAMLHDCMKRDVETIDDNGVSHFYNHANVSAYYVLTHPKIVNCKTFEDMIDIIFYITYHMDAHNLKNEKTINKYKNVFGDELFYSLMDFVENDKIASNVAIFNKSKQNIYIINDDYAVGYTRLGDKFYVDTEDVPVLAHYTWCIKNKKVNDYRLVSMTDGSMKFIHRVIMNVNNKNILIDHINHKQYDNRKINLRACSVKDNCRNTSLSKNNSSGVNGVSKMSNGKYRAYITVNGEQKHLGIFNTLNDARNKRLEASKEYYGDFANLNI